MLVEKHLHLPQSSWDRLPSLGLSADGLVSCQRRPLDEDDWDLRTEGQMPSSWLGGDLPQVEQGHRRGMLLTQFWLPKIEAVAPTENPRCSFPGNCCQDGRKNMFNAMALMYDWNGKFLTRKWRVVTERSFSYYCFCDSNETLETPLKEGSFLLWLRPDTISLFILMMWLYTDFVLNFNLMNKTQGKK